MDTTMKLLFFWVLVLVALSVLTHLFWDCAADAFAKAIASAIAASVFCCTHF